jgi:hypothetical protein
MPISDGTLTVLPVGRETATISGCGGMTGRAFGVDAVVVAVALSVVSAGFLSLSLLDALSGAFTGVAGVRALFTA